MSKQKQKPTVDPLIVLARKALEAQGRAAIAEVRLGTQEQRWQKTAKDARRRERLDIITMNSLHAAECLNATREEFFWTESAMLMTEALRHSFLAENAEFQILLPEEHLFFLLEHPLASPKGEIGAFFLLNRMLKDEFMETATQMMKGMLGTTTDPKARQTLQTLRRTIQGETDDPPQWMLYLFDPTGQPLFGSLIIYEGPERGLDWDVWKEPLCEQCRREDQDDVKLCSACRETFALSATWFGVAMQMLNGRYQQFPDASENKSEEIHVENEVIEMPAAESWKPARRVTKPHRMQVVRFDACLRTERPLSTTRRGSWLAGRTIAQAVSEDLDPAAIIYVPYKYEYRKTYRSDRYAKSGLQGQQRQVDVEQRMVPVTVATLFSERRKRTKVLASRYQPSEEN